MPTLQRRTATRPGVLIAAVLAALAAAACAPSVADAGPGHRSHRVTSFDAGWRFALASRDGAADPPAFAHAADPTYDDSAWRAVTLPHDWSIELAPTTADDTTSGTGFEPGGVGWYRKAFTLPRSFAHRDVSVEFDGVYMDSTVFVNGHEVATHPYGYTGFSVPLTGAHADGRTPNVIAVEVRNHLPSSRWYSGSGIYRHVHLVVTDRVHVARHGVTVTTPGLARAVKAGSARVRVQTAVDGVASSRRPVTVVSRIRDPHGAVVGTRRARLTSGADAGTIRVAHPALWSPARPSLYTLETVVLRGRRAVDRTRTTFGLRWTRFDPDRGLFVNGHHLKLHGVDLHHDAGALGSVTNSDAIVRQLRIMQSMGVNALRTSHNPPSPELVAACQRLGIVMMIEAFDTWRTPKVPYDYGRFFDAHSDADVTEMVQAAKNSPAVIMWSIGNEIPDSTSPVGLPMAKRLIADVRAVDATRPIVMGSDKYRSVPAPGSPQDEILKLLDGLGLNYNTAASVDALHARYPTKFLFESESSSETSTRGVYQDPDQLNTGENHTPGKRGASSYDNNLASWTMSGEYGLKKDRDRRFFLGQFLWAGMDYIGEPTPYDVFPVKTSFFGAVDTAGFAKDMYWLFRSQWTQRPMVHLLPMNWTDHRRGEHVQVWAYANADTVQLFLNGRSLGVRRFDGKTTTFGQSYLETTGPTGDDKTVTGGRYPGSYTSPNGSAGKLHLTWDVPFAPGRLVAVASRDGHVVARDEVDSAGAPATLRLTPDRRVVRPDGRSLSYVTVDVVDRQGVMVPDADNLISYRVTGGRLVGLDNGREEDAESYKGTRHTAFNGKALAIVQSDRHAGPITITASSPGLEPASTTVFAARGGGARRVGIEPATVRTPVGRAPRLPATVRVVSANGSSAAVPVHWAPLPAGAPARPGRYVVTGDVAGARAVVTVYAVRRVIAADTVTAVGAPPTLPARVTEVDTDGVVRDRSVRWDPVQAARYAHPGRFAVTGTVAGVARRARADVRVSDDVRHDQDLAAAGGPERPHADASYSGSEDTIPAAMIDGDASTGWSNYYSKDATALLPSFSLAHATDWVSVAWPRPQRFGEVDAAFTADATHERPAAVRITYWNGRRWAPVRHLAIDWATASDAPTTFRFDPVGTTRLRLDMTSAAPGTGHGFVRIAGLKVVGDEVG